MTTFTSTRPPSPDSNVCFCCVSLSPPPVSPKTPTPLVGTTAPRCSWESAGLYTTCERLPCQAGISCPRPKHETLGGCICVIGCWNSCKLLKVNPCRPVPSHRDSVERGSCGVSVPQASLDFCTSFSPKLVAHERPPPSLQRRQEAQQPRHPVWRPTKACCMWKANRFLSSLLGTPFSEIDNSRCFTVPN